LTNKANNQLNESVSMSLSSLTFTTSYTVEFLASQVNKCSFVGYPLA